MQFNLYDVHSSVNAALQVTDDEVHHAAESASGSLLAPVAGPEFRLHLTNSPRLFLEGDLYGMYFFGYGSFVSIAGALGFAINRYISLRGGYQMASRLVASNDSSTNRIGFRFTQEGPTVGVQLSF